MAKLRAELNEFGRQEAQKMLNVHHHQQMQNELNAQLGRAGIPTRFLQKNFENYQTSNVAQKKNVKILKSYLQRFDYILENGTCCMMVGKHGTGKTHCAVALLNEVVSKGYTVVFTSVAEILRRLRSTYSSKKESELDVYNLYTSPDLIVIDEVGVAIGDAEKRKAMLFDLINARYNELKPTVLIGNLSNSEMETYLGTRIYDRLLENNGFTLLFEWDSYRSGAKQRV